MEEQMFKPMLAPSECAQIPLSPARFPLLVSPKLDGIRATIQGGRVYARSMKLMVNDYCQELLSSHPELEGLDGELIVGDPTAEDCFNRSGAVCVKGGKPDFVFYVFDRFEVGVPFQTRLGKAEQIVKALDKPYVQVVPHTLVRDNVMLQRVENLAAECGYEGLMLRNPNGPYKQSRCTYNEGYIFKMKRWVDGEGEILELLEGKTNLNPAFQDELGHTKRSSAQDGKKPNGTLGSYRVRNLQTGQEHKVSPSGTMAEQQEIWNRRAELVGKILKFKYQAVGTMEKPRFSQALGFRDVTDMDQKEAK